MRTTNQNKINSIKESVLDLSQKDGLFNLTTAKIAKGAGVSPATIYLHYNDKIDLLSRLYEEVKINLHKGLSDAIDNDSPLDTQIKQAIFFIIKQYRKYPKQAYFMSNLYTNSELLDEKAKQFGRQMVESLVELFQRINNSNEYSDTPNDILEIFFSVPTLALEQDFNISDNKLDQISNMIIKAIKK